jgi:hypothetical protein
MLQTDRSDRKLNQVAANEIDRAYWNGEKRRWPVDLMGGAPHSAGQPTVTIDPKLGLTIIKTEQLLKDDEPTSNPMGALQVAYHQDDYPKLPNRSSYPIWRKLRETPQGATDRQLSPDPPEL